MQPSASQRNDMETALQAVVSELQAVSAQVMHDAPVRARYMTEVERGVGDIRRRFASGGYRSVADAARAAHELRNAALDTMRARTSPLGLVIARNLKEQGVTLNEIIAKRTIELFGPDADFHALSGREQNRVHARVLERAAVTNQTVSRMLRRLAPAARGIVLVSVGYAVYEIAVAEDKVAVATQQGGGLLAGVAGGAMGGAVAGLVCGPGSPVCVPVGAFVGGALAAFGFHMAFTD